MALIQGPGWFKDALRTVIEVDGERMAPIITLTGVTHAKCVTRLPISGKIKLASSDGREVWHWGVELSMTTSAFVFDSFDILDVRVTRELVLEPGYIRDPVTLHFEIGSHEEHPMIDSFEGELFSIRHDVTVTVKRPWYTFDIVRTARFVSHMLRDEDDEGDAAARSEEEGEAPPSPVTTESLPGSDDERTDASIAGIAPSAATAPTYSTALLRTDLQLAAVCPLSEQAAARSSDVCNLYVTTLRPTLHEPLSALVAVRRGARATSQLRGFRLSLLCMEATGDDEAETELWHCSVAAQGMSAFPSLEAAAEALQDAGAQAAASPRPMQGQLRLRSQVGADEDDEGDMGGAAEASSLVATLASAAHGVEMSPMASFPSASEPWRSSLLVAGITIPLHDLPICCPFALLGSPGVPETFACSVAYILRLSVDVRTMDPPRAQVELRPVRHTLHIPQSVIETAAAIQGRGSPTMARRDSHDSHDSHDSREGGLRRNSAGEAAMI